jgi:hypothetical protein
MDLSWIDFTRRNDPACPAGVDLFRQQLSQHGYPSVLCFWTKAPATVAELYHDAIAEMQNWGTLVLAQVTMNCYGQDMEPGITPEKRDLGPLVDLIGAGAIRLRFDPIIPGYSTMQHFLDCLAVARKHGIRQITANFLVAEYKGVGRLLQARGFDVREPTIRWKIDVIKRMHPYVVNTDVEIAVCAESAYLATAGDHHLPWLKPAKCADPDWAISLCPDLADTFKLRPSRKGCGCAYSGDWGQYRNRGSYRCPHGCLYCYAK